MHLIDVEKVAIANTQKFSFIFLFCCQNGNNEVNKVKIGVVVRTMMHSTHSNIACSHDDSSFRPVLVLGPGPGSRSWVPVLGPDPGFLETRSSYLHPNFTLASHNYFWSAYLAHFPNLVFGTEWEISLQKWLRFIHKFCHSKETNGSQMMQCASPKKGISNIEYHRSTNRRSIRIWFSMGAPWFEIIKLRKVIFSALTRDWKYKACIL